METKKTLFGYGKPKFKTETKFSISSQVPSKIPAIYDGSRLIAYKLLDKTINVNDEITVKAKTPEGDLELSLPICKDSFIQGNSLHQLFARKMIQEVEEKHEQENVEESKKLITELGLKYNLASKYTSFVGVDEKQGNSGNFMVTRHIKNQMPQNHGSGFGFGGFGSSAVIDSASRSRGFQSPPGAAYSNSRGSIKSASSPPGAMAMFGGMQESLNCTDSLSERECSQESYRSSNDRSRSSTGMNLFGSQTSSTKSQSSSSDVLRLTMCQAANGSFPPQADIASILGVELVKVLEAGKAISSGATFTTTWMTVVVVAFLTEKCKEEKDVWELVVEKAKRWLQNNGDGFVSVHLEKAKEFILQAIPIRESSNRTCP